MSQSLFLLQGQYFNGNATEFLALLHSSITSRILRHGDECQTTVKSDREGTLEDSYLDLNPAIIL